MQTFALMQNTPRADQDAQKARQWANDVASKAAESLTNTLNQAEDRRTRSYQQIETTISKQTGENDQSRDQARAMVEQQYVKDIELAGAVRSGAKSWTDHSIIIISPNDHGMPLPLYDSANHDYSNFYGEIGGLDQKASQSYWCHNVVVDF